VDPSLAAELEAARAGDYECRSAFAIGLASRWLVEQVAAKKQADRVECTYALRVDGADLGFLSAAIWPEGPDGVKTALLFKLRADPALPLMHAGVPLIEHARSHLTSSDVGVQRVMGVAMLPGLCQWIVNEQAWRRIPLAPWEEKEASSEDFAQQRAAVEAVATTATFESLDAATLETARRPFEGLAMEYAAIMDSDAESTAMEVNGGRLVGIHWQHDTRPEALRAAAGCTASYEFDREAGEFD